MFWSEYSLDDCWQQQQHVVSLSSLEAVLRNVTSGIARELLIGNALQTMGLKTVLLVGTCSSTVTGIDQRREAR